MKSSSPLEGIDKARRHAIEVLRRRSPVSNKAQALDALDRLALNPSGWLSERVVDQITVARKKILVNHWPEAIEALEAIRTAMIEFMKALKDSSGNAEISVEERSDALLRAADEIDQCVQVLSWIDHQPPGR